MAIKRLRVLETHANLEDLDAYIAASNIVWRERHRLGCASCGKFCKYGNAGYCRRCWLIRARVRNAEAEIYNTIPSMLMKADRDLRQFLKSLGLDRSLSQSDRLLAMLEKVNGNTKALRVNS